VSARMAASAHHPLTLRTRESRPQLDRGSLLADSRFRKSRADRCEVESFAYICRAFVDDGNDAPFRLPIRRWTIDDSGFW